MSPPSWTSPSVFLITSPSSIDTAALRASTADAIVICTSSDDVPLSAVTSARDDLPIVVLADMSESDALELLAQGADHVLPATATMPLMASAVRMALARRSRRPRPQAGSAAGSSTVFPDAPQLQAIARLSGGIAHEFNNLLTVVEGNVARLQQGVPVRGGMHDALESISNASRQAAALTRQLLAFGRQQTLMPASVDVNAVVTDAAASLRHLMGDPVRVVTELARELPHVRVDRDQIAEVLTNLAATSQEAMPDGGTFRISTDVHAVTDEERRHRPWLPDGRFVRIRVSDTGLGMEEHALPHLFEPFFTSTLSARGKGLTLSSVYGVVKQSGGFIWADSRVNKGTTVTILLPPLEAAPAPAVRADAPSSTRSPHRVLLVEDTDAVRQTLTTLLEWHGFSVTSASTAEEALEFARTLHFDLLLTDVALSGRSGPELAAEFRHVSPGTPVIFMSGYSANSIDARDLDTPRAFLQKPFPVQTLVDRINELLAWAQERKVRV